MALNDNQYNQARNEFEAQNQTLSLVKNGNYQYTDPATIAAFAAFLAAFEANLIANPPPVPQNKSYTSSDDIAR